MAASATATAAAAVAAVLGTRMRLLWLDDLLKLLVAVSVGVPGLEPRGVTRFCGQAGGAREQGREGVRRYGVREGGVGNGGSGSCRLSVGFADARGLGV